MICVYCHNYNNINSLVINNYFTSSLYSIIFKAANGPLASVIGNVVVYVLENMLQVHMHAPFSTAL